MVLIELDPFDKDHKKAGPHGLLFLLAGFGTDPKFSFIKRAFQAHDRVN